MSTRTAPLRPLLRARAPLLRRPVTVHAQMGANRFIEREANRALPRAH